MALGGREEAAKATVCDACARLAALYEAAERANCKVETVGLECSPCGHRTWTAIVMPHEGRVVFERGATQEEALARALRGLGVVT